MTTIRAIPITAAGFAPFGELLTRKPVPDEMINQGRCERHRALATVERGGGEAIISILRSNPVTLPYECFMLERHPLGSQAFMPLGPDGWLSVVAHDKAGQPDIPLAFLVPAGMGLNLRAGVWHGFLTPLNRTADFLVIDREGDGQNLEKVNIPPVTITA